MKCKNIILLCALILCSYTVSAQKLGFIGGPSMNHGVIVDKNPETSFRSMPGGGFHAGMLFEMDVTNRWGFDFSAMYELRTMRWNVGYRNDSISNRFRRQLGYLNVPFHFYVNFPIQNQYVMSLFAGPVFTCGLHGHDWAVENNPLHKPVTEEAEKMFDKKNGRVVRCEIAAELGLAFKWKGLQGRLSYQYGLNNSATKHYQNFTLPINNHQSYFMQGSVKLSVAYVFDLRK